MPAVRIPHYPASTRATPTRPPRHAWRTTLVALGMALLVAGCGGKQTRPAAPAQSAAQPAGAERAWPVVAPANPVAANAVTIRAIGLVGTPYRYGGNTPEGGFDCSGLVNYVYNDMADKRLPRTTRDLFAWQGPRIAPERLAAGDLVFFGSRGSVTHVGIYVGEGRFVHAPSSGGTVRLDHLDGHYWRDHYSGSRRILAAEGR